MEGSHAPASVFNDFLRMLSNAFRGGAFHIGLMRFDAHWLAARGEGPSSSLHVPAPPRFQLMVHKIPFHLKLRLHVFLSISLGLFHDSQIDARFGPSFYLFRVLVAIRVRSVANRQVSRLFRDPK